MKKQISNLLILLLVFSSLIVSCDDGSDDLDPNICEITVSSSGNGSVSITNYIGTSENVLLGSNVEVVATPDEGCEFLGWFVGEAEEPVSTSEKFAFVASKDTTLTAKFAKLQNLTISSDGNGRVSFKDTSGTSKTLLPGSEVTVIATPGENYEFAGWYIGEAEEPISTDSEYTFTVSESVTLVAKFNQLPLVALSCSGNGTVSFADSAETSQYIQPGSEVTVIATPGENYEFAGWYIGEAEEPISTDSEYTFTVSESVTLVAKFNQLPLVALSCSGNGTVSFADSAEASQYIQPGSEVIVIATPGDFYEFVGWYIGEAEEPISTDAEYTFTVSESVTLVAKFNQLPLVALSCSGNGTVSFADSAEASQYIQPGSEVTVIATPGGIYEFVGWFVGDAEEPISTDAEYTFIVSESVTLVAKFTMPVGEAIDLGLPSGIKWASFNVGATKPEEYGGFYAWGETEEKDDYSWETYKWCNGSYDTMTKYCTDSDYGTVDNKTVLEPEDDVAHVKWGGDWRMPTTEEQRELVDECTWEWTTLNGVNGYKVTGSNGNSIFLPAAGYRFGTDVNYRGYDGYYWSSSLDSYSSYYAYYLSFGDYYYDWDFNYRCFGQSVRPVSE